MNGDGSIELLAPAGSFDTALAAFDAGADAVYLGLGSFSARADAVNFTPEQLRDVIAVARDRGRRVYVTFNTLIDQCQLADATRSLALLEDLAPDGIIVQDLGVARIARRDFPGLALHASTQLVAHNLEGALALRELGFTRIVLARELPIDDIRSIAERCGVEIEVFVHGALCYSISGLCLFSAMEKNRSGNRGRCAYCCRLAYTDAAGVRSLPFSMRDLRLDDSLDALRGAGVASLKIEGRMKSPLYVASVTSHYRQLLDGAPVTTTRADLETVHLPGRADRSLAPSADEFAFRDGVASCPVGGDRGGLMARAAVDFQDYLRVSMQVDAIVRNGGDVPEGALVVRLDRSLGERASRIEVGEGVSVSAGSERAAMQALAHLEDLMNLRCGPFLKKGVESRESRFSVRMTHSGYGNDIFPEEHLSQMAHFGMTAILVFLDDIDKTKAQEYQDLKALVRRAAR